MLTHDQLAFAVNMLHPHLVRWKDFWTAHPVAPGSDEQRGEAEIIGWQPTHIPQPSMETLRATFAQYREAWQASNARAASVRAVSRRGTID